MTAVERIEAAIKRLASKHAELSKVAAKRASLVLEAHDRGGDAAKELHSLNKEAAELAVDLENVATAIEHSKQRLDRARRDAANEANRQKLEDGHIHEGKLASIGHRTAADTCATACSGRFAKCSIVSKYLNQKKESCAKCGRDEKN